MCFRIINLVFEVYRPHMNDNFYSFRYKKRKIPTRAIIITTYLYIFLPFKELYKKKDAVFESIRFVIL